jgi:23S rRNA (cytidine1920-2'-O)/16S rRNA (cytidine1409-2'-O)-methyltransferase
LHTACEQAGLEVLDWLDSPVTGGDGNREFFIHVRRKSA